MSLGSSQSNGKEVAGYPGVQSLETAMMRAAGRAGAKPHNPEDDVPRLELAQFRERMVKIAAENAFDPSI